MFSTDFPFHKNSTDTRSASGFQIALRVPDEERAGEVNVEIASSGENHAGVGFAEK